MRWNLRGFLCEFLREKALIFVNFALNFVKKLWNSHKIHAAPSLRAKMSVSEFLRGNPLRATRVFGDENSRLCENLAKFAKF